MRNRSALWESLTKRGHFELHTKATINGIEYTSISAPVIDRMLMSNPLEVGNCNVATLTLSIMTDDVIPTGTSVSIQGSVVSNAARSEWLPFGTFYIDQRDTSYEGLVTIRCYDAMLKCNQGYITDGRGASLSWPKTMRQVVDEIAQRIGVEVDNRTAINAGQDYVVPYPEDLTLLQVLGYIGACHGGNWVITEENKLRLVKIESAPAETYYVIDSDYQRVKTDDGHLLVSELNGQGSSGNRGNFLYIPAILGTLTSGKSATVTGVSMIGTDGIMYMAGDDTGAVIELGQNPYATPSICDTLFAQFDGLVYAPFSASDAIFDPAAELGDQIAIGDRVLSVIMSETLKLDVGFSANISAPNNEDLSKEYPYTPMWEKVQKLVFEIIKPILGEIAELDSRVTQIEDRR